VAQRSITSSRPVTTITRQHGQLERNGNASILSQKPENQQLSTGNPAAAGSSGVGAARHSPIPVPRELGHLRSRTALHHCQTPNALPWFAALRGERIDCSRPTGVGGGKNHTIDLKKINTYFPPFGKVKRDAVVYFGVQRERETTGEQRISRAAEKEHCCISERLEASEDGLSVLIAMEISLRNRFSCHIPAQQRELSRSSQQAPSQGGLDWTRPHGAQPETSLLRPQPGSGRLGGSEGSTDPQEQVSGN